jgi:hypothetical protein
VKRILIMDPFFINKETWSEFNTKIGFKEARVQVKSMEINPINSLDKFSSFLDAP